MRRVWGLALAAVIATGGDAAEVWFAPNDHLPRGVNRDVFLNRDFPRLFEGDGRWSEGLDVFEISPNLSVEGKPEELQRIAAFLAARGVGFAVGVDATLIDPGAPCGSGVEGFRPPDQNAVIFARLKRLKIDVKYVTLDEPLTYGHFFHGKGACGYSIAEAARRAAAGVAEMKRSFPDLRVQDAEAPPAEPLAQWRADFAEWLRAYREAAGEPLDSVVFDVDLFGDWRGRVAAGLDIARRNGVRAGVFLFKPGPGASDADAVDKYLRAAQRIDASGLAFDIVMVANWSPHPFANLPPSDPTTLTYVLQAWNRRHPRP